jgi:hypothetical protein
MAPLLAAQQLANGLAADTVSASHRCSTQTTRGKCVANFSHVCRGKPSVSVAFTAENLRVAMAVVGVTSYQSLGVETATVLVSSGQALWVTPCAVPVALCGTPLRVAVSHVVCGGAKKQMIRSDARRIIAVVTDEHACRDQAVGEFVGNAMSARGTTHLGPQAKPERHPTVATCPLVANPEPTRGGFVNARPEPGAKGRGILEAHRSPPLAVVPRSRPLATAREHFCALDCTR